MIHNVNNINGKNVRLARYARYFKVFDQLMRQSFQFESKKDCPVIQNNLLSFALTPVVDFSHSLPSPVLPCLRTVRHSQFMSIVAVPVPQRGHPEPVPEGQPEVGGIVKTAHICNVFNR